MAQRRRPIRRLLTLLSAAVTCSHAALPKVDFGRMGKVAVAGSFAGLDLYDSSSTTAAFDSSTSTLFLRGVDESLTPLGSTNAGGRVLAGCSLGDKFYFGGEFTTVAGQSARNVVAYTPSSRSFTALAGGGLDGQVAALYCDEGSNTVWVGGAFDAPTTGGSGFKGSVALYNPRDNTWSPPPFAGLSGAGESVQTITPNYDHTSLLFGGSFVYSFQGGSGNLTLHNNPNVPQSTGATPFTSSLVPFPLFDAEVNASSSSSRTGLGDITAVLCPAGADGPGNTWFGGENSDTHITIRAYKQLNASGLRLGNTFFDGQSTTEFTVTAIPENRVLTLTYNIPGSLETRECTGRCPLSTDSTVAYQDFLFPPDGPITGIQITLTRWTGTAPGLHLLQLLSNGAFAPAIPRDHESSCYSPGPSTVVRNGEWVQKNVVTSIPATIQAVLTATVPVGSTSSPSITWNVYTSASGLYDIYMMIPGCINTQDCGSRTSVDVTINAGGSQALVTTTVSQRVESDTKSLIYSGAVIPSDDFTVVVSMQLASRPEGTGADGNYILIADRVILELTSADIGGSSAGGAGGGGSSSTGSRRGFGFFEWTLRNEATVDATATIPNTTETTLDGAAFALFSGLGSSATTQARVNAIAVASSDKIYLAGNLGLSSGGSNFVSYNGGSLLAVANGGVNAPVSSIASIGENIFVGGSFESTADGTVALRNIGLYNSGSNRWFALGGGVDGDVTSLVQANGQVIVTGNFTHVVTSSGAALTAGGFATWDIQSNQWTHPGGLLIGQLTFVANATSSDDGGSYVAGNVRVYRKFGADGMASLENGRDGQAVITPLGVRLDGAVTPSGSSSRKRTHRSWGLSLRGLLARQGPDGVLPTPESIAPSVLAGAFWTNTTSSKQVIILGGNFTVPEKNVIGLAVYDPEDETITGLSGNQVNGVVRSLLVTGSKLYVGGDFTVAGVSGSGFAVYDLSAQAWVTSVPGLQATTGTVTVRSITNAPSLSNTIIVAGSYASAGSTQCGGLCSFDTNGLTWSALGSGLQGDISSVAYAGDNSELLLAGGTFTVAGSATQLAMYSTQNQTWTGLGQLPGPVTAFTVNERNQSCIFAAGTTASGAYVYVWTGAQWSALDIALATGSNVAQLEMVPLSEEHGVDGIIQRDRMLLVSGSLSTSTYGDVSSGLYDGYNFYPYLVTSNLEGEAGSVSSFFHSFSNFSFDARKYLAVGVVILISIALGAGIVFLLGLIGILWTLFARRDDRAFGQDTIVEDDDDSVQRPSSLLAHVTAATRNTILGAPKEDYLGAGHKGEETAVDDPYSKTPRNISPGPVAIMMGDDEPVITADDSDVNRPAQARYSFDGKGEGELPLTAGAQVIVLNDQDPTWWYVRDRTTNKEGIVPSSYLV